MSKTMLRPLFLLLVAFVPLLPFGHGGSAPGEAPGRRFEDSWRTRPSRGRTQVAAPSADGARWFASGRERRGTSRSRDIALLRRRTLGAAPFPAGLLSDAPFSDPGCSDRGSFAP